jgi:PAT family beta-lactamase induction signal transducer AmpG
MEGYAESRRIPPDFVTGMGTLTFGFVVGFSITAMPFLLSKAGVSVDRIAAISATAMSPTFFTFLLTPIVDVGFTRRTYALGLAVATAASLGAALFLLSPARLPLFTALLFLAVLCAVLQNNAVFGWMTEFVPDERRGKVGGWQNAANLGGGAAGSMLVMSLARSLTIETVGILMTALVLVSPLVLLWFPRPAAPKLGLTEIFGGTFRSVVRTSRQPNVLTGFLLFLLPAGCVAATNLFSGLGKDFAARPERVIWATGAGVALFSSIGALLGGYLADRVDRKTLYLSGGALAGLCSISLALLPHTETALIAGVLAYNGIAGICYAAFSALSLELAGVGNPTAATQLGLFAAATNAAIVYMTWADGQGYRLFGIRGLFLVDGLAGILASTGLMIFLRRRRLNRAIIEAEPAPEEIPVPVPIDLG